VPSASPVVTAAPNRRRLVIRIGQWALLAVMATWLLRSGVLDLRELRRVVDQPRLLVLHAVCWSTGAVLFGAIRWSAFLRSAGIVLPLSRAVQLQAMAIFANVALPGGLLGDVLKAMAAARSVPGAKVTTALGCGLGERFVGLTSLLALGLFGVVTHLDLVRSSGILRLMALTLSAGFLTCVTCGAAGVMLARSPSAPPQADAEVSLFRKGVATLRSLGLWLQSPSLLALAFAATLANHLLLLVLYTTATEILTGQSLPLLKMAVVFSPGILTTVFPLTPGGLGVGHAAFEILNRELGLSQGANAFNLFYAGQLAFALFGAIPYVREAARARG
jgi:glycosyltransferase 2 family protein